VSGPATYGGALSVTDPRLSPRRDIAVVTNCFLRLLLIDRCDVAQLPFDLPAPVILLHAARFSVGVFGDNNGLVVAADCLAAFDAKSRVGENPQSGGRNRTAAPFAVALLAHI
jgi:hypothetical protein